ncbi:M1-specific T cell receptor beta chain-like [Symphalangus syndactylus]|uniref:M1-specific T cell receptor beta chain-like n=1 Tax=Symphalangus syndactylus TaxID=9590 RepID=UPI0030076215
MDGQENAGTEPETGDLQGKLTVSIGIFCYQVILRLSDVTVGTALWGQGCPSSSAPTHSDSDLVKPPSSPDPALGTRLLCWVALCLLGADHGDTGVSQGPRHKITKRGRNVTFRCDPISEHNSLYWYQQTLGQGPEFLTDFQNEAQLDKSGLLSDRFSAERPKGSFSTLKIQCTEQGDSAMYLCASSLATAWHSRLLPAHKPSGTYLSFQLLEALNKGAALLLPQQGERMHLELQVFF